jgi:hypothetical protein
MRCMKLFRRIEHARGNCTGALGSQHKLDGGRRVDDDQRRSRSSRMIAVGDTVPE